MELFGLELGAVDLQGWLQQVRDWALPRLLQSAGLLLVAGVAYLGARWALTRLERHFVARTRTEIDDLLARLVRRSVLLSIAFWAAWRLAYVWELPTAAAVVSAAWIVGLSVPVGEFLADVLRILEDRVVSRTETTLDDTALPLLNRIIRFLVIGAAAAMALRRLGIDITPLVAGAGVVGIAVSFAAKDTLSNVIAGFLLILDRPFRLGDRIELWSAPAESATWGDVVEIGLRATKIRTPDNLVVVIPNNEIMRRDIINYTISGDDIRVRVPIGVAYDADVARAKEVVLEVARDTQGVLADPEPKVIVRSFGESAVNLEARVWIQEARRRRAVADEITERVKEQFHRQGIEIPYPKRDLYIKAMPEGAETKGKARQLTAPGTKKAGVRKERGSASSDKGRGGRD